MTAAVAGDHATTVVLEDAVTAFHPALVRRIALVVRDLDEAEDICQAAYLAAYRSWHRYNGADIRAWLYSIAFRLALNELRRRKRALAHLGRMAEPIGATATVDPDLWAALADVEPRARAALLLNSLDGYTHVEIGLMLGVPAGTVGSWLTRTKARLREVLQETSDE